MSPPTARHVWRDHVWDDSGLTPTERLVALAFEKYASAELVWVSQPELMRITGLKRTAALNSVRSLQRLGWLELVEKQQQHRAPRYRLTLPITVSVDDTLTRRRVSGNDTLNRPRVSGNASQGVGRRHRISTRDSGDSGPLCRTCSRTEASCRAADSKVALEDRHQFQAVAA